MQTMVDVGTDGHVVVVGGSLAGTRTAQSLRQLGFAGPITLIGAEDEIPYDRPPLSKDLLASVWSEEAVETVRLTSEDELRDLGIEARLGSAAIALDTVGRTVELADGSRVSYDVLVIATGASARPSPWRPTSGVYQLRTLSDSRSIATRLAAGAPVAIVGGGFIGTEIAAAARSHGCEVTVIDPLDEPMARLVGPEVAGSLVRLHERNGVRARFGVGVVDVEGVDGDLTVTLADGTQVIAGTVVVGIGSIPSTAWLEGSGLLVENGVVCDDHLRARGVADVYAVGDVASWEHPGRGVAVRAEHWTNASDQARYVAKVIADGFDEPYSPSDYVWSDQYDWKVHAVGWRDPEGASTVIGDLDADGRVAVIHADAHGVACGAVTVNWVRALNQVRRMLAQHATAADIVDALIATASTPVTAGAQATRS